MNKITIQKVIKEEGSVIEFAFYATKDNGHQVEGVFSLEELKKIIEKVESLKNHTSDYENMPTIDENFWKIVPNNKLTEDGINPEWAENFDKAEFYSRDLSYPAGVYKKFYNELYKSKDKVPAGEVPSNVSKYWAHIPKKIGNLGI